MAHKNVQICHPWAQRINEQGKGIIKIDVRDGYTLINHINFYQRTHDNVVQIAWGILGQPGKFDKTNIIGFTLYEQEVRDFLGGLLAALQIRAPG